MAITVYWAPWGPLEYYANTFLSYKDPIKVLEDLSANNNTQNKFDNFFKCPAFINSVKNTYLFTSPSNSDVTFSESNRVFNRLAEPAPYVTGLKAESMTNRFTIKYDANWIFFCEEPLYVHSTPPFMHKSIVTDYGFYVPGTYDISQWFRPLEYAFQLWDKTAEFKTVQDEPLMYINFLTSEPIKLQKFYMTKEIYDISMSCIRLKDYRREKNLFKLYELFKNSKIRTKLLTEIKKNVL